MADVVSPGVGVGGRWKWGETWGTGVIFWWENLRGLRYKRRRGSPPSGVAPACPKRHPGVSKGSLAPVIPRALGHCVPVDQTVTQAGQGFWPGWPGVLVRMILIPRVDLEITWRLANFTDPNWPMVRYSSRATGPKVQGCNTTNRSPIQ